MSGRSPDPRAVLTVTATATVTATSTATSTATVTADSGSDVGQACGTNDLTFTISEKPQAGGYLLVTAKALPGITCYLEGVFPSASFGSSADTELSPAEHSVSETLKLSGNTVAYAGINPKTTDNDSGRQFEKIHLSVLGDEINFVTLDLPRTVTVDRPIATNWHADPADAVPFSN
ncbi:DUF4232 domain-containing protein [Streptomyces capitiformicae]|uniref:DUF4232 domain-containing protein n=1 Tax=Streptomyces capitiformicae TaxID=2014920 RepID=A0A918Z6S7_9ACTN|nr:DUF4232 domain-containing protein [Streptomyces capitiformicae]GHE39268.1 hypothetical protein GCM10017771_57980 [Streptomyces capitiformicae]